MPPLITIGIPTLQRLSYLKEAVESALKQEYPAVEVLISDDGEDSDLRFWCEAQTTQDSRVRYQHNVQKRGLAGNWNEIAAKANGEYLTIIGDDDRLLPNFATTLSKGMSKGANVAFSNHYLIDSSGLRLEEASLQFTKQFQRNNLQQGKLENPEIQIWENAVPMSSSLLRTSDVKRLRFNETLNTPEIEFFLRLAQEGGQFYFMPDYLAEYRLHGNSATASGLWTDKLIEALMPIDSDPVTEPYKERFLSGLLFNGINRCLIQGDWERVQAFLKNPYCHLNRKSPRTLLQRTCSGLPKSIGWPLYRTFFEVWKRLGKT